MVVIFGGSIGFVFLIMWSLYFCAKSAESAASWLGRVVSGDRKAEKDFYREQGANLKTIWFYHNPNWREVKASCDRIKMEEDEVLAKQQKELEKYQKEEEQRKDDYMKKLENW